MTINALAIRNACLAFNLPEFPEAEAEIEAGTPALVVSVNNADKSGRAYRFVVSCMIVAPDGGHIGSEYHDFVIEYRRDGRERMTDRAERVARRMFPVTADIPVIVINNQR